MSFRLIENNHCDPAQNVAVDTDLLEEMKDALQDNETLTDISLYTRTSGQTQT